MAYQVSIHAPTRGATGFRAFRMSARAFQSTHPRGVRLTNVPFVFRFNGFNPRTHEGCDVIFIAIISFFISFNPRTHEGCDSLIIMIWNTLLRFNPRTHEGCDFYEPGLVKAMTVSIHAPTRGATAYSAKYRILIYKSSHFANINQTITFKVIKSLEFL